MSDRYNLFELPHKPFRLMWAELLGPLGAVNPTDEAALARLEARIEFATEVYAQHNREESEWLGPRLRVINPELADRWLADHADHQRVLEHLAARARSVCAEADVAARRELLADLYRFFCEFMADDLAHMSLEQGEIMCELQAAYDDDELRALERAFLDEQVSADQLQRVTPLFLRAGNLDERARILALAQRRIDHDAFEDLMARVVPRIIPAPELAELRARLGLAA
ncbi:MAG TPA: hypothetical protein PLU22_17755 [Polyangiaceae bacterium]|nr:hypothetical protein [Polyangiaceae bacterium]